jgi:hypothetical protein
VTYGPSVALVTKYAPISSACQVVSNVQITCN